LQLFTVAAAGASLQHRGEAPLQAHSTHIHYIYIQQHRQKIRWSGDVALTHFALSPAASTAVTADACRNPGPGRPESPPPPENPPQTMCLAKCVRMA
jgi:hypothetical protein